MSDRCWCCHPCWQLQAKTANKVMLDLAYIVPNVLKAQALYSTDFMRRWFVYAYSLCAACRSTRSFLPHTAIGKQKWGYVNAQSFLDGGAIRREPVIFWLSADTSYLTKALCISIAMRVTSCCTWGGRARRTLKLLHLHTHDDSPEQTQPSQSERHRYRSVRYIFFRRTRDPAEEESQRGCYG